MCVLYIYILHNSIITSEFPKKRHKSPGHEARRPLPGGGVLPKAAGVL